MIAAPKKRVHQDVNLANIPVLHLCIEQVVHSVGLSKTTIEEMVRQRTFPEPVNPTPRRSVWRVRDLENWSAGLTTQRPLPPENTRRLKRATQ